MRERTDCTKETRLSKEMQNILRERQMKEDERRILERQKLIRELKHLENISTVTFPNADDIRKDKRIAYIKKKLSNLS